MRDESTEQRDITYVCKTDDKSDPLWSCEYYTMRHFIYASFVQFLHYILIKISGWSGAVRFGSVQDSLMPRQVPFCTSSTSSSGRMEKKCETKNKNDDLPTENIYD